MDLHRQTFCGGFSDGGGGGSEARWNGPRSTPSIPAVVTPNNGVVVVAEFRAT